MKRNHQVIEPDNTCVDACSCTSSTFQVWLKLSMINAFKLTSMGSKLSSKLSLIACPFSNLGSPTILKIGWLDIKISLFGELSAKFKNRYFGPILPSKMSWEFKVAAGTDLLVYDCEKRAFFTIKLHLWLKEQVGNKKCFWATYSSWHKFARSQSALWTGRVCSSLLATLDVKQRHRSQSCPSWPAYFSWYLCPWWPSYFFDNIVDQEPGKRGRSQTVYNSCSCIPSHETSGHRHHSLNNHILGVTFSNFIAMKVF